LAEAKGRAVEEFARVKVEAQRMLLAIRDGLQDPITGNWQPTADIVSIRLIEVLKKIASLPPAFPSISDPDKAIEAWQELRRLLRSS
jgi:hypothetical protein